ncbi:MAG: DUF4143 domain-containing protein [Coriobacteriia bacterium]|nr:DUF4143 domain-containing protein [Coriobacteriia bacterium]
MTKSTYLPRLTDIDIERQLRAMGGVLIEGPKWCGKTRSSLEFARSVFYTTDNRDLARTLSDEVLMGATPRLVDEWQLEPVLWDKARRIIDERSVPGQFIFTGSSTGTTRAPAHSGAGRFALIRMRTMSLFESGESDGSVSLAQLFDGTSLEMHQITANLKTDILWALTRGGWPAALSLDRDAAGLVAGNYVKLIQHRENSHQEDHASRNGGARLDRAKQTLFVRALARNVAQPVKVSTLIEDVRERGGTLSRSTADNYLNYLKSVYFVEEQPAWSVSLRAKTVLRQAPKRHLTDPSLAVAALGASPAQLLRDFRTLGHMFESLCYRDLCIYAQHLGGEVAHYRDASGFEIDEIVTLSDGRWAALEVKLGDAQIDEAAQQLRTLTERIDTRHIGEPAFLAILYAGQYAYTRPDGVHVIPIACLSA